METLYQTSRGDFASARSLTPNEAVEMHRKGWLSVTDYDLLSDEAAMAVGREMTANVAQGRRGNVVFWGVCRPTFAHRGRA